jgi:Ni/Fe-hydrogenase subunit HybB-like protein
MTRRKIAVPYAMLALPACVFAQAGTGPVAANRAMVTSYWGYIAFLPLFIVAFLVHGWLIRPKG